MLRSERIEDILNSKHAYELSVLNLREKCSKPSVSPNGSHDRR